MKTKCPICGEMFPKWERDENNRPIRITLVEHCLLEHPDAELIKEMGI